MNDQASAITRARSFVTGDTSAMLIDGAWLQGEAGATFDSLDPSTGDLLCSVAQAGSSDIDRAVEAAKRAFRAPGWAALLPHDRARILLRIADLVEENADELAAIQSFDMGMLYWQSQWMVRDAAEVFRYYAGWVTKIYGNTFPLSGPGLSYTRREPLGVVAAIIPWNGPSGATAWKVAPSLACGNTVVLKPAEQAPLVSLRMAELIQQAGLPDGVLNVLTGDGDVGAALVAHLDVAKISFTGSTEVGKSIVASGAESLKRVTLELGGKSPTIIFPDADLDRAVASAVTGFTIAAGQGCVAGSRVLIHRSIYDDVTARIADAVRRLRVGPAFDAEAQVPAVVSREQHSRISDYIRIGREEGARLVCGGDRIAGSGYFIQPTVFADVRQDMRIVREEIFGPVGALMPFDDIEEAIRLANDVDYGLSASIWTNDIGTAQRLSDEIQAGIVWVNTIFELNTMAPFGGFKQSGLGRELGPDSIDAYTQTKTIVVRA